MNIGMLWFDNDPKATLEAKINRAVTYYTNQYGKTPNLCYVHPCMLRTDGCKASIEVRASKTILPNHFWLGIDNEVR